MSSAIKRVSNVETITVGINLAAATVLDMTYWAGGILYIPAGAAGQLYTYNVCDTDSGTFLPLFDKSGSAVTITVAASQAYEMHTAAYGALFIKLTAPATETGVIVMKKG